MCWEEEQMVVVVGGGVSDVEVQTTDTLTDIQYLLLSIGYSYPEPKHDKK